jgi:hypothetical protein
MTKVNTTKGILDSNDLNVGDFVSIEGTARVINTKWFLKSTGELVRSDCWVSILVPQDLNSEQGKIT